MSIEDICMYVYISRHSHMHGNGTHTLKRANQFGYPPPPSLTARTQYVDPRVSRATQCTRIIAASVLWDTIGYTITIAPVSRRPPVIKIITVWVFRVLGIEKRVSWLELLVEMRLSCTLRLVLQGDFMSVLKAAMALWAKVYRAALYLWIRQRPQGPLVPVAKIYTTASYSWIRQRL